MALAAKGFWSERRDPPVRGGFIGRCRRPSRMRRAAIRNAALCKAGGRPVGIGLKAWAAKQGWVKRSRHGPWVQLEEQRARGRAA